MKYLYFICLCLLSSITGCATIDTHSRCAEGYIKNYKGKCVSQLYTTDGEVELFKENVATAELNDDLINAAGQGDLAWVKYLLAKGADVNAKSSEGRTALMLASGEGHSEVVQALKAKIAADEKKQIIRRTAVDKLTDQALLAKLAVEDKDQAVRRTTVKKLTDQALLAKLAVEDKDLDVRHAAMEKLTDQVLLVKIVVEDKDQAVRRAAVDKLTDQALLAKLAVEDKDQAVRRTTVKKLTDQALLAKLAVEDKDLDVRRAAMKKLDVEDRK
ncbi:MAG: ankyrin repeat domain-containing protein, partial [Thermodesulfovibrionales bacterium]